MNPFVFSLAPRSPKNGKVYKNRKKFVNPLLFPDVLLVEYAVLLLLKQAIKQAFVPHLCGVYSTQVSRLLHTSVEREPHKCGLSVDF